MSGLFYLVTFLEAGQLLFIKASLCLSWLPSPSCSAFLAACSLRAVSCNLCSVRIQTESRQNGASTEGPCSCSSEVSCLPCPLLRSRRPAGICVGIGESASRVGDRTQVEESEPDLKAIFVFRLPDLEFGSRSGFFHCRKRSVEGCVCVKEREISNGWNFLRNALVLFPPAFGTLAKHTKEWPQAC